jgi:hypothetical protein
VRRAPGLEACLAERLKVDTVLVADLNKWSVPATPWALAVTDDGRVVAEGPISGRESLERYQRAAGRPRSRTGTLTRRAALLAGGRLAAAGLVLPASAHMTWGQAAPKGRARSGS